MVAKVLSPWMWKRVWCDDGSRSPASRLSRECGISGRSARKQLRRAHRLVSMPATAEALAQGKLSIDKADLLAYVNQPSVAELFARDEAMLVDQMMSLHYVDALVAAKYWLRLAEDEIDKLPPDDNGRYVQAVSTFEGPWTCGAHSMPWAVRRSSPSSSALSASSTRSTGPWRGKSTGSPPASATLPETPASAAPTRS